MAGSSRRRHIWTSRKTSLSCAPRDKVGRFIEKCVDCGRAARAQSRESLLVRIGRDAELPRHRRHFGSGPRLLLEPGRSLVGNAGLTVYEVGTVKEIPGVSGVHVMAYRQEEYVAEIVDESGVLKGRQPWKREIRRDDRIVADRLEHLIHDEVTESQAEMVKTAH